MVLYGMAGVERLAPIGIGIGIGIGWCEAPPCPMCTRVEGCPLCSQVLVLVLVLVFGIGIGIGVCRAQSLLNFSIGGGAFLGCFRPERLLVRLLLPRALPGCPAIIVS